MSLHQPYSDRTLDHADVCQPRTSYLPSGMPSPRFCVEGSVLMSAGGVLGKLLSDFGKLGQGIAAPLTRHTAALLPTSRFVVASAVVLLAAACERKEDLNVRIAVYLHSNGEDFVFSETYSVNYRMRSAAFKSFDGAQIYPKTTGEAVVIQAGSHMLFASYLSAGATPGAPLAAAHRSVFDAARKDEGFAAWIPVARTLTIETSVPRKDWPVFIGFEDPSDTTTAHLIEAEDLPWGKIRRVTVQATSQAPDMGDVARVLPWIKTAPDGSICPEEWDMRRYGSDKIPCQHIVKSNFVGVPDAA